ncbi:MAG TPA: SCO family protein [Luteolibacter sp.]|nr:SCO family protein [Luteolibacter sp.]
MKRTTTIALFYSGIALLCAVILGIAFYLRSRLPEPELPVIVDAGRSQTGDWFEIGKDLEAVNQNGETVKLSDLRGKVWIVAEFFAVCPHCAVRNGRELREIYDKFRDHPDFHVVCITVDPEQDDQEKLSDYAKALGADANDWWFLNAGDMKATHAYLENELKFFGIRERSDPADIEANGRFAHDLGILLVDREWKVIGKWPLADARSEEARQRDPGLYERLKSELYQRIEAELEKNETPGI